MRLKRIIFTLMVMLTCSSVAVMAAQEETAPSLPNADVLDLGMLKIEKYAVYNGSGLSDGGDPITLQIALDFMAKDTEEEANQNAYANHTTDFYITMSGMKEGTIKMDGDCYLAGNYGTFGWIMIPLEDMEIENEKIYPVITTVGFDFSYVEICTQVKDFMCGIHLSDAVIEANPDLQVKLELGLSESMDEAQNAIFTRVGEPFVYSVADMTRGQIQIGSVEGENVTIGGEEATEEEKTALNDLLEEIASNVAVTEDIETNLESEQNQGAILNALKEAGVVDENATESDIISIPYVKIGLKDVQLDVEEEQSGNTIARLTFNVAPTVNHKGTEVKISNFVKPITFRLPVPSSWTGSLMAYHEGTEIGTYNIQGDGNSKYIEIKSREFSEFAIEAMEYVNAVAKVDGVEYETFAAALAAAEEGETIILLDDVVCTEKPVFGNGSVVYIDVNGHVFESNDYNRVRNVASSDGTIASNNIKFVNGYGWEVYNAANSTSIEGTNFHVFPTLAEAVTYEPSNKNLAARIYIYEGNVKLESDVILRKTGQGTASTICIDPEYSVTLDLNGYTVLQESPTGNPLEACIRGEFVLEDNSEAKSGKWIAGACGVTDITNGTWYGNGGPAFYVLGKGCLTLKGGTVSIARNSSMNSDGYPVINGGGLIRLDAGSLIVDGATLQCEDTYGVMAWGGNVTVNSGTFVMGEDGVYSIFAMNYYSEASVEVNSPIDGYLLIHSSAKATVNTAGVRYYSDGENYVAPSVGENLLAKDGIVGIPFAKIGENKFFSLQDAINAVGESEATITLLTDITLSEAVAVTKSATIDLAGKTVTAKCEKAFVVSANSTIKNGIVKAENLCVDSEDGVELTLTDVDLIANKYAIKDGELTEFVNKYDTEVTTLTYTRTLASDKFNALFVPFSIPLTDGLLADYDFFSFQQAYYESEENCYIEVVPASVLDANVPYLVRPKSEEAKQMELVIENATLNSTTEVAPQIILADGYDFAITGTYSKLSGADNAELAASYGVSVNGRFAKIGDGTEPNTGTLGAFRYYVQIKEGSGDGENIKTAREISIRVSGESDDATGIVEIESGKVKTENCYDLSGRCVQNAQKGIFIVNGKKVVK